MRQHLFGVLAIVAAPCLCVAATPPRVTATAVPEASAFKLDGEFNEAVWERAPATSDFRQRDPKDDAAPSFPTELKVAYDAENMYIAVTAHDPDPGRIVALRTRRDSYSPSDWISVMIDSFHDRRTAFEFAVNPAGVKRDTYWFNDNNQDDGWDAVWEVAVSRDAAGWRAEFRIPFSQLRFNNTSGGPVGFSIMREVGRLAETSTWPLLSRNANGFVSQFGELRGLRMSGAPKRFELMPYSLGKVDTRAVDTSDPLSHSPDPGGSFGLDMKYAVTPGLTVAVNVMPGRTAYFRSRPSDAPGSRGDTSGLPGSSGCVLTCPTRYGTSSRRFCAALS